MRSFDFIEMYKEKNNLPSDYKAAKELGVTRQSISLYKNGRPIDEDLALKIAESLNIEPSEILYVIAAEKTKKPEAKKAWLELSKIAKKQSGKITIQFSNLLFLLVFIPLFYILC